MGKRRRARELALTILYQLEFRPEKPEELLDSFWADHRSPPPEVGTYAKELVEGTLAHREEIDSLIAQYTEHWHFSRIALVERNILRVATYEFIFRKDVPEKVILNEGIEIAKQYGSEDSGRFVNGILDKIRAITRPPLLEPAER
ncbi:MAG: transcription antitermination factor NusB [Candidatus Methylomirabilales bacterium]